MDQNLDQHSDGDADHHDILLIDQRQQFHQFMSECSDCQEEVDPHWQYCAHCGTRLATKCPGCGNPLPPAGAPSCLNCGLAIPQVNI